eukprot:14324705-Ditylum_brightwellii.AAC.1
MSMEKHHFRWRQRRMDACTLLLLWHNRLISHNMKKRKMMKMIATMWNKGILKMLVKITHTIQYSNMIITNCTLITMHHMSHGLTNTITMQLV